LGNSDRHVRYAARIAIEGQPVEQWASKALDEQAPLAAMTALLALSRVGGKEHQEPVLKALAKFPMDSLNEPLKLDKLRVIEVSFIRQGRPPQAMAERAIEKLSRQYPARSFALNHELSQLLVWLDAPDVVGKTLELMKASQDPAEQIWYAYVLREAKQWTPDQRMAYFSWFPRSTQIKGGNSLQKFLGRIRDLAMTSVPDGEKQPIEAMLTQEQAKLAAAANAAATTQRAPAVQRQFQKTWTVADLEPELPKVASGRNFERGKEIFTSLQCAACHRFNNEGGGLGPDISAVGNRFSHRDLLESIIDPSKVISDQYASFMVKTKKGQVYVGQIAEENNDNIKLITDPLTGASELINQMNVKEKRISPVSTMPTGLIDVLTVDEVYDLLAYIETGGKGK
jgi:putative heme-binding domain-containing protein